MGRVIDGRDRQLKEQHRHVLVAGSSSGRRRIGGVQLRMLAASLTRHMITELLPCWDCGRTDAKGQAVLRAERERIQSKIDELQAAREHLDEITAITGTHP